MSTIDTDCASAQFTVEEVESKIGQIVYLQCKWFGKPVGWRGKVVDWKGAACVFGGASKVWVEIEWDRGFSTETKEANPLRLFDTLDKQEYSRLVSEELINQSN